MLASALIMCCVYGCQPKAESTVIYPKPVEEKLDSVCEWLKNNHNYYDKTYMPTFYNYYNYNINKKEYKTASRALEIVSLAKIYFVEYEPEFTKTITNFSENYRQHISNQDAIFLDCYMGNYYATQGDNKKAIPYFNKTILCEPKDYTSCEAAAHANFDMSYCYFSQGKQQEALLTNFKAEEYFKKNGNIKGLGSVYANFSSIYLAIQNFKLANDYQDKAMVLFKEDKDTSNIFISLYNRIYIYEKSGEAKKMYALIDSTYHLFKESKFKKDELQISIYTYYIDKLLFENNVIEAKQILDELNPLVKNLNSAIATSEYNLALTSYKIKKNDSIVDTKLITDLILTLKENKQYDKLCVFYGALKNDALQKKDYKNALLYEEEIKTAQDSLGGNVMANKIIELNTQYQTEKKDQQIILQEKTITNRNTTIALLGALLIGLFLLIILYVSKQKQKKLLKEQQNIQHYTKQLLEKTEEERKRIASDLHDSVSHELLSLKNSIEAKTDVTNNKIDAIINDIRIISRNLHPVMFDKIGLKASIEQMIDRAQSANDFMVTATINYNGSLSSNVELQVYRILQETLSNIIKYADAIAAKISINENQHAVYIEIKDNGKGFDVTKTLASPHAFGLHNIIERSKAIGGEAKIVSDKNGTIITIEIPITRK